MRRVFCNVGKIFELSFFVFACGCATAAPVPEKSENPYGTVVKAEAGVDGDCASVPTAFVSALDFPSKYEGSGSSRDELNSDAEERYKDATGNITEYEKGLVSIANRYVRSRSSGSGKCFLTWLSKWANDGALLGQSTTHTGKSVRKWVLASISSSYFRVKHESPDLFSGRESDQRVIESWIRKMADLVMREWPLDVADKKINNHYYWAAWSLVASGLAIDDKKYFDYGLSIYRLFEKQVTTDGLLPNELLRRSRALSYHAYALSPLVMIAAFAHYNDVSVPTSKDAPLTKLAESVFRGLSNPESFEALTGAKQEISSNSATNYAWLEPYCAVVACSTDMLSQRDKRRPLQSTRMGGDLTVMFSKGLTR
ncbi:mannuronate-specific alginate lyase [Nevskia ramosa]|uniref:mannuronate-specific alginate lyase n=1 Tax=Nevskia ramosa TaxID=64002 RepID=UPI001469C559|nr:mannuronate-specific alginate lyase [Nevskia ramosa]